MALYRDQEFLADNIRARQSCSQRGGLSCHMGRGVGWAQHLALHAHDMLPPRGITGGRPRLKCSPPALHIFLSPSADWSTEITLREQSPAVGQNGWACDWVTHCVGDKKKQHLFFTASHFLLLYCIPLLLYIVPFILQSCFVRLGRKGP